MTGVLESLPACLPGGQGELAVIAIGASADPAAVNTHHLFRWTWVISLAPIVVRIGAKRRSNKLNGGFADVRFGLSRPPCGGQVTGGFGPWSRPSAKPPRCVHGELLLRRAGLGHRAGCTTSRSGRVAGSARCRGSGIFAGNFKKLPDTHGEPTGGQSEKESAFLDNTTVWTTNVATPAVAIPCSGSFQRRFKNLIQ